MTDPEILKKVSEAALNLGEHFDSVQIMVSWRADGGGTRSLFKGAGDWYARQGLAHAFIKEDEAEEHAKAIAKELHPDEPE